jgi:hypothetical protein
MTGRRAVLRMAGVLISEACRRLPDDSRHDREQEWTAGLAVIIDDPGLRPRWRRHLRAMRFAMAQSRTVRRLTRPAGLERVRAIMVRTALASAGAAVVLAASAIILDLVAGGSSSDSSPVVVAEIWALTLTMAAGLLCALIVASLGMTRLARSFRPQQPPASREAGRGHALHGLPAWREPHLWAESWPSRLRPLFGLCPTTSMVRPRSAACWPYLQRCSPSVAQPASAWRLSWRRPAPTVKSSTVADATLPPTVPVLSSPIWTVP